MYMSDYDDYFMPVNHRPGLQPSRLDRTWVQMILPYSSSFGIFRCPSDVSQRDVPEAAFDEDLIPGDIYSRYYAASMRVNVGYNYIYLAPITQRGVRWTSEPKQGTSVTDPSRTLMFVDSIWDRTADGRPTGGGNWLVVPPCRYQKIGDTQYDTFNAKGNIYTPYNGWSTTNPNSAHIYGNAWPWHDGLLNVMRVDGSARAIQPKQLLTGCSAKEDWQGFIDDASSYLWDTQ